MERRIVCFNVASFEIVLARLNDSTLRGWPTVIAPVHHARSFLWEVSREARQEGLYAGMALSHARRLCPRLRLIAPDSRRVFLGQKLVQNTIKEFTALYELANYGEFYADVSGTSRLFGDAPNLAARMGHEISQRHGISGVLGVATNKLVSGVAANFFQSPSVYDVSPGHERPFLAPLPVSSLPRLSRLFGQKTKDILENLEELRLGSLGHVAAVSVQHLQLVLGGKARLLRQWAAGVDPSPVWPEPDEPISELVHTFEIDEVDDDIMLGVVYRLVERLCNSMRRQSRCLNSVGFILTYTDGQEIRKSRKLFPPTCLESEIYPVLEQLFLSISRRLRVRRIELNAEHATEKPAQLDLFSHERFNRGLHLAAAIDSIRDRYGNESLWQGRSISLG